MGGIVHVAMIIYSWVILGQIDGFCLDFGNFGSGIGSELKT